MVVAPRRVAISVGFPTASSVRVKRERMVEPASFETSLSRPAWSYVRDSVYPFPAGYAVVERRPGRIVGEGRRVRADGQRGQFLVVVIGGGDRGAVGVGAAGDVGGVVVVVVEGAVQA